MPSWPRVALLAVLATVAPARAAELDHIDPATGYRIERYQAAVPDTPPAGTRVWLDDIDRLIAQERAVLIDVAPITGAGFDPVTGDWRSIKDRETLPGAYWLPEVGRGRLDDTVARYLAAELERLTGRDTSRPIVVFCTADCWMSWNAMKRFAALGYTRLYWFPEGTDGWRDFDRPLVRAVPVPIRSELLSPGNL
ncbi:MAG: rhodanese-like domain-containing protein [Hyphomicrobiaceae bacterium]